MIIDVEDLASLLLDAYNKGYQTAIDVLTEAGILQDDVKLWKEFVEKLEIADKK